MHLYLLLDLVAPGFLDIRLTHNSSPLTQLRFFPQMILFRYQCSAVTKSVFAIVNLKTAKQIGLTIPPDVLSRASRLIK